MSSAAKRSSPQTTSVQASVEQLIHNVLDRQWVPPPEVVPGLDRILQHNRTNPTARIGIRRIKGWLREQGVEVGRDALDRWLKKRGLKT